MKTVKNSQDLHRKNRFKARQSILLTLVVLTLIFFSINFTSAAEWDNIGSYDEKTKTMTIKNRLGFGGTIASIQLTSPLSVELPLGYYNFANITISGFKNYNQFLSSMDFYDRKINDKKFNNKNEIERDFDVKVREVEEFEVKDYGSVPHQVSNGSTIYNYEVVGSHLEERIIFRELTKKDIKKNEVLDLELFTTVQNADNVEWVGKFMGVRIDEWAGFSATGCDITFDGDFQIHTCTVNSTFTVIGTGFADILVVAGGGAGGKQSAGGGAGGYTYFQNFTLTAQAYEVIVGVGGDGINDRNFAGENGTVSVFDNLTTIGGGGGSGWGHTAGGEEGGSGGGSSFGQGAGKPGAGTAGQGFRGGFDFDAPDWFAAGGGGAGEVGFNGTAGGAGDGGDGLSNEIFNGTTLFYAGGGGGAINEDLPSGDGGLGGGGDGGEEFAAGRNCSAGTDGLGGGGGGGSSGNTGCDGGDGIVIIRFLPIATLNVTLEKPDNNTLFTTNEISMNCTVFDEANDVVNVSLVLDGIVNETNSSGINNSLYNFDKIVSVEAHNWTCKAANNVSDFLTAETRFFDFNISVGTELISPIEGENLTESLVDFVVNSTPINQDLDSLNLTLWFSNGTVAFTNSTPLSGSVEVQTTVTPNLTDGNYIWTAATIGELTSNTTINRTFTVHTTPSTVAITFPTGNIESFAIGDNLNLNWSITEPGQNLSEHIVNCSFTYNSVETFLNLTQCIEINSTTFLYVNGVNNLSFTALEEFGLTTTNTTSWTFSFLETSVDFEGNVSETSDQSFEINLTTDISVQSISAILTYDGSNHTSIASCSGGDCTISNLIDIPLVASGNFELKDFFWNLAIFNGTSSSSIVTSTRQQNVTRIFLEECNATFPVETLNFTTYDERTLERISPFSFDGAFDFWIGGGTVKRNNSLATSDSEVTLCLQPNETMQIDATIDYNDDNSTDYTSRFYYFDGQVINNVSQDIFMYLLNSSFSTSFILKVQDDSLLPVADALIEIHRYYPGTDEFRIVQIAQTDDGGKSVGFFETETVDYKFIIKKDGETLLETGQQKVIPETSPFTLIFNVGDPLGTPWASQEPIDDLNSNLTWNDDTFIIAYTYIDSSEIFTLARLQVIKDSLTNASNSTLVCNETSTLISATLTCSVGSTNGFYTASSFITRDSSELLDRQFPFQIETLSGVVGLLGLFFGWFLILIASTMFKFNEIAGIWAITITVFLVNLIGLIKFGGVFVTAVIAMAIIITWVMER